MTPDSPRSASCQSPFPPRLLVPRGIARRVRNPWNSPQPGRQGDEKDRAEERDRDRPQRGAPRLRVRPPQRRLRFRAEGGLRRGGGRRKASGLIVGPQRRGGGIGKVDFVPGRAAVDGAAKLIP